MGGAKVTGNENVKVVFMHSVVKKWIYLCQMKTKMIDSPFCTNLQIHFTGENASFCDVIMQEGHMSHWPPGHAPTFLTVLGSSLGIMLNVIVSYLMVSSHSHFT